MYAPARTRKRPVPRGDETGETGARRKDDSERCSWRGVAGMFADVSLNVNAAPSLRVTYCVW